jgi:prepilin-type N-terminal cleavage/methylation domain-containing protein
MLQNIKKRTEGFTIIEVLIVLAIAGLIMLIVFLAVPALQRNSRNTQRRNDAGRITTALNDWVTNNNGQVFTAGNNNANLTAAINSAGNLGQYTLTAANNVGANSFSVVAGTQPQAALPAGANNVNLGSMRVVTGATCSTTVAGGTTPSTQTRRMAVQYLLEGGGAPTPVCLEV